MSTNGDTNTIRDVIIIGGGPAGALAGLALAQRGRRSIILEKLAFPRFHVGESLLPASLDLFKKLGIEPELRKLPHTRKYGAFFSMGNGGRILDIDFADGYCDGKEALNIERALLDDMLLREAQRGGAEVRLKVGVKQIISMTDGDCRVMTDAGEEIRAKYILDASGQGSVIGRHLGTRRNMDDPKLQKTAFFNHFEKVERPAGEKGGNPLIVMMEEGWFWLIPLDEKRMSVGMVIDAAIARRIMREENVAPDRMLQWGIARCPAMRRRMKIATAPEINHIVADFSFRCRPYAGEGYFLIGDAAAFMDPIFSTGVCVAGHGGMAAVAFVDDILASRIAPAKARAIYIDQIEQCTAVLFKLIQQYYDHSFRELFLMGKGPLSVHRALIGLLAGNVFPRPPWKIRWRKRMFDFLVELNRKRPLVPRRRRFALEKSPPQSVEVSDQSLQTQ
ncbi:MAG TPA: NAD(P)/FAD-dependent oxidoreductase [Tepidisphaeraceae bacterium]|jgi:FADH2-dependent halogenase|nr:NAD(P)/FAD-dependent oxidoreductase [Tepidisphaeraceae bacterium]